MRLVKPGWVSHGGGKPIFSIDVHPDGSRFATGGLGDDCGKVVVWNMAPVRNEVDEMAEDVPKVLCCMSNHLACVNCVRWSNHGNYLASGADDNLIMIWHNVQCSGTIAEAEQWSCAHILRGHSGDVLDVAWSPDDSHLASCSVDNCIIVWRASCFPEITARISNHVGMVKGLTWDPVGKYLASQSDDQTLRIWRTSDWQEETTICKPFDKCGASTHVLRLSWSPDGHYIVSAHALNNSGPVAKIVERSSWKASMDFVGHRKAVQVTCFNPNLFQQNASPYTCCAIGSRDRSLSVWLTCYRRPILVMHDLFTDSITDLSWSSTGFELLVCSCDGSVAFTSFSTDELGIALSPADAEQVLHSLYGCTPSRPHGVTSLIENPALLQLRQKQQKEPKKEVLEPVGATPEQNAQSGSSMPVVRCVSSGQQGQVMASTPVIRRVSSTSASVQSLSFTSSSQSAASAAETVSKQRETRTQDGRRRITPLLVMAKQSIGGSIPTPFGSSPAPAPLTSSSANAAMTRLNSSAPVTSTPMGASSGILSTLSPSDCSAVKPMDFQPLSHDAKTSSKVRSMEELTGAGRGTKRKADKLLSPTRKVRRDLIASKGASSLPTTTLDLPGGVNRHQVASSAAYSFRTTSTIHRTLVLPAPEVQPTLTVQVTGVRGPTLEVDNCLASQQCHVLCCSQAGQLQWKVCLSSRVLLMASSRCVTCVACEDRSLLFLSPQGRRLSPSICLESPVHRLCCHDSFVMVVTVSGHVHVWDSKHLKSLVSTDSLPSLLRDEQLTAVSLTDNGSPLVTIATVRSYMYSPLLMSWLLLGDADDVIHHGNSFTASGRLPSSSSDSNSNCQMAITGSLSQLQGQLTPSDHFAAARAGQLAERDSANSRLLNRAFLEHQVASSLALQSTSEYHFWVLAYVRYLTQEGLETSLREVCSELMKGLHRSSGPGSASCEQEYVLGISKFKLLKEFLPIVATNLSLQRLVTQLQDELETSTL